MGRFPDWIAVNTSAVNVEYKQLFESLLRMLSGVRPAVERPWPGRKNAFPLSQGGLCVLLNLQTGERAEVHGRPSVQGRTVRVTRARGCPPQPGI